VSNSPGHIKPIMLVRKLIAKSPTKSVENDRN